jgi:ComF family protein
VEPAFLKRPAPRARLAALLFPASCVHCAGAVEGSSLGALCLNCWKGLNWLEPGRDPRQGQDWHFSSLRSAAGFEGPWREAIHAWKFEGKACFGSPFVELLAGLAGMEEPAQGLAWVPSSPSSLKARGYEPVAELARPLARRLGLPLLRLKRRRDAARQASLGREARWKNVQGAFEADLPGPMKGKSLLLVDDVVTTGATLNECARALVDAGADRVRGITLASGELRVN